MKGLLVIFLCFLRYSLQKCTPEDDHYVAAVVEFPISTNVTNNLKQYVNIIKKAAKKNADIIVFPERTLTGVYVSVSIPIYGLLKKYPIPAAHPDKYDNILVKLSSAAKKNGIYVVANVKEVLDCTQPQQGEQCPGKRKYFYSTNIKCTPEDDHYVAAVVEFPISTNVTNNLKQYVNIIKKAAKKNADIIVFPERTLTGVYVSVSIPMHGLLKEYPIPAAHPDKYDKILVKLSLAAKKNGIYVVANVKEVLDCTQPQQGSGIFSGKAGALTSVVRKVTSYRLLVAQVPKIPGDVKQTYPGPLESEPSELDSMITLTDTSIDTFLTKPLEPGYQEFTLDYQDVSCSFTVNITLGSGEEVSVRSIRYDSISYWDRWTYNTYFEGNVRLQSRAYCY
ncbi:hypothetical protein O3G_MSEX014335 [Manduca sexta]|uniref:CN hydrolase domain-containing protein n=1 Tax=Manduca sexta TaxID=7130 RepID=A0A921ZUE8_MANSE|nr:hypothetical protein O3G_MSEX014335 [Manduca sexta]